MSHRVRHSLAAGAAALASLLAACGGGDKATGATPTSSSELACAAERPAFTPPTAPLAVVGAGSVTDRYTAEVSVAGSCAYTTTWGRKGALVGNVIEVWNVGGAEPLLVESVTVSGATTLGDVQVADGGKLLVVATEFAPGSIVVYDLADPTHPRQLSRFSSANTRPGVHTAEVQRVNGRLYAFLSVDPGSGFPARLVVVDLSDPRGPREVFAQQMGTPFVHDVFVRDGILFTALWDDGLAIWDVGGAGKGGSPSHPVRLGGVATAGGHVHNVWWLHDPATGSKRYAFVGEESPASFGSASSGDVHVVDVSDFASPREVAFYHVPGAGTHNFSVDEAAGVLYAAYYNAGVRALDVRGDLGTCSATQQDATGRCDLSLMHRELAAGLTASGSVYVWGVQVVGDYVYASDMLKGVWKLTSVRR